jgi:hypothetical protein
MGSPRQLTSSGSRSEKSCGRQRFEISLEKRDSLHIFRGTSERAYTACLYLRYVTQQGQVTKKLLCYKLKVAPVKKITLPELELCGALLLTQPGQNQVLP